MDFLRIFDIYLYLWNFGAALQAPGVFLFPLTHLWKNNPIKGRVKHIREICRLDEMRSRGDINVGLSLNYMTLQKQCCDCDRTTFEKGHWCVSSPHSVA